MSAHVCRTVLEFFDDEGDGAAFAIVLEGETTHECEQKLFALLDKDAFLRKAIAGKRNYLVETETTCIELDAEKTRRDRR